MREASEMMWGYSVMLMVDTVKKKLRKEPSHTIKFLVSVNNTIKIK